MLSRPRQKCLTHNPSIKAYDPAIDALSTLEKKDFVKYLGVLINYKLPWKNHIDLICLKISRIVGILARLTHTIPLLPLLNIYQALISPYLYYGICVWGSAPKTYLTLGRTSKFIPPPWYKGGGWMTPPPPPLGFLICCSISKRF